MTHSLKAFLGTSALVAMAGMASADQVFTDDVIIDGSLCVGVDCVNGESFGFDTIRLKENNLRIRAFDTSSSGSFPTVDWQITFNDSVNGGQNKFSVDDLDTSRTPFTIESGVRSNQLYLADNNKVGFGTSTPVVDLHVKQGNTPTLRLEQDGSSGFATQTWDLAGNETNFFVRDVTNGSRLPFKVFPNAPTNALIVEGSTGDIGLGIQSPTAAVHINRSTGSALDALKIVNNGGSFITMENTAAGTSWFFTHQQTGNNDFIIADAVADGAELTLTSGGNLIIAGTLTQSSDKNAKMAIEPIDSHEVLAKVSALPLSSWTYKHDADTGARHIGPMAQDFHAAFGTGYNDTTISTLDTSGVALAAIQALHAQTSEQQALIATLSARLESLEAQTAD